MSDLGLPDIDRDKARRLSQAGMAALRHIGRQPPPEIEPTEADIRAWLAIYCQAWADLQSFVRAEVRLHNLDLGRDMDFTRERLRALEQQIARLQHELGQEPTIVPVRARIWA